MALTSPGGGSGSSSPNASQTSPLGTGGGAAPSAISVGGMSIGIPDITPGAGSSTQDKAAFKGFGFTVDLSGMFAGGPHVTTGDQALVEFQNAARGSYSVYPSSSTGQYVAIQDAMLKGGFYGSDTPTFGVLGPADITAFQKFLVFAGQNYDAAVSGGVIAAGQAAPSDLTAVGLLNQQAAAGVQYGTAAAARRRQAAISVIRHVNPQDSAAALEQSYKQLLGRDPTAAEKAAFQAAYDAQVVGPQEAVANAQAKADYSASATAGYGAGPGLPGVGHVNPQNQQGPRMPVPGGQQNGTLTAPPGDIDSFMAAISGQESGGNYNAVNKDSGASGRFQIMPSNWPSWAQQAGLPANAPRTPQNQDLVAKYKMSQYYNQFHDWGAVAAAWYGGPSAGAAYLKDPNQAWLQRRQGGGKYPSIAGYAASVTGRMTPNPTPLSRDTYDPATAGSTSTDLQAGMGVAGAPGSDLHVVDAASLSSAAEAAAKTKNPTEYGAHQVANTFNTFLQLLGGVT